MIIGEEKPAKKSETSGKDDGKHASKVAGKSSELGGQSSKSSSNSSVSAQEKLDRPVSKTGPSGFGKKADSG